MCFTGLVSKKHAIDGKCCQSSMDMAKEKQPQNIWFENCENYSQFLSPVKMNLNGLAVDPAY